MTPLRQRLLAWYDADHRDLPWRSGSDPWAVWVSEIMLQQTRVEAVREPYARFLQRFPTPEAFARCTDRELQVAWRGLGYYRRARLLRDGARAVVRDHGGQVPGDPEALGRLPGIGPYTRGAVASIAFGHPEAAIDGNVERVAARHSGIRDNIKRAPGATAVRGFVQHHMDRRRPGDFNQALMELGATVCTPRSARCSACPIGADCVARARGQVEQLPMLPARRPMVAVATTLVAIPAGADFLALVVPQGEPNGGQWELPGPGMLADLGALMASDPEAPETARAATERAIRARCGAAVALGELSGTFSHGITHHRITVAVHLGELAGARGQLRPAAPLDPEVPWTTASRKAFGVLGLLP